MFAKRFVWFYGLCLIALGSLVMGYFVPIQEGIDRQFPDSEHGWPSAPGQVTRVLLECERRANGEGDWYFDVRYTYTVHNNSYTGTQRMIWYVVLPYKEATGGAAFLRSGCGDLQRGLDVVGVRNFNRESAMNNARYVPGGETAVRYKPSDHSDSVLVPGLIGGMPTTIGKLVAVYLSVGGWLSGIGLLIYAGVQWFSTRKRRTADSPAS
jgi:hypothetical protein